MQSLLHFPCLSPVWPLVTSISLLMFLWPVLLQQFHLPNHCSSLQETRTFYCIASFTNHKGIGKILLNFFLSIVRNFHVSVNRKNYMSESYIEAQLVNFSYIFLFLGYMKKFCVQATINATDKKTYTNICLNLKVLKYEWISWVELKSTFGLNELNSS